MTFQPSGLSDIPGSMMPNAHIILDVSVENAGMEEVNHHLLDVTPLAGSWLSGLPAEYLYFPVSEIAILNLVWTTDNLECNC